MKFLCYVVMDRSWVHASRITDVYENGVEEFLEVAQRNATPVNGKYYFSCVNCLNGRQIPIELI